MRSLRLGGHRGGPTLPGRIKFHGFSDTELTLRTPTSCLLGQANSTTGQSDLSVASAWCPRPHLLLYRPAQRALALSTYNACRERGDFM